MLEDAADDMRYTEARRMEYSFVHSQVEKFAYDLINTRRTNTPTFAKVKKLAKRLTILLEMDE